MKKSIFAIFSLATLALTSCAEKEVTYKLDSKATTLNWTGKYVADGHTHSGTVNVTEGSVVYKGEELVSGDFTVDLNTIVDTDLPSPMKDTLVKHLKGMYFFNIEKNAEVDVKINEITKTEIKATLTVLGKKIEAVMPVKIKKDEKSLTAKGKFEIDFASTEMMGFQAMPETPKDQHTDSKIAFEINLVLNK